MSEWFSRSEALLGGAAMARLHAARVLVVGVGGVGSWCAEALVRTGLGEITLVDDDVVAESNVNRQCPATAATVGRAGRANGAYVLKATVAEGATCAVTRDGNAAVPLTAGANVVRYATGETGLSDFVFTADALGPTVLSSIEAEMGTLVILR